VRAGGPPRAWEARASTVRAPGLSAEPIAWSHGVLENAANLAIRRVSTLSDNDSDRVIR